jgi:hypothetical protein
LSTFVEVRNVGGKDYRVSTVYDVTRRLPHADDAGPARPPRAVAASLAGCTFLECLERSPLGETWKIQTPDGRIRVAYYLRAGEGSGTDWRLDRLQLFSHADMPGFEVVESDPGRTVLLSEGFDRTLQERFKECWLGRSGIPRAELLGYLRTVADALDAVFLGNGFQHLGLNPGVLWLDREGVRVGGFGLIQLLWLPSGQSVRQLNPRYAAPELARGRVSRRCDQYSLALIFAEMLTGIHPLYGPPGQRRNPERTSNQLDLHGLCSADQEILGRALHRRPTQRFPKCADLVKALETAAERPLVERSKVLASLSPLIAASAGTPVTATLAAPCTSLSQFITELVALATGPAPLREFHAIRYRLEPGESLEHRCAVKSFPGAVALKLEGFRQQWHARSTQQEPGVFVFSVSMAPSFWRRLTSRPMGLRIEVQLKPGDRRPGIQRTEVAVTIRPFGCSRTEAVQLLAETGPVLLESVRSYLQACPEQREQQRLAISQPLRVRPVLADMQLAQPIHGIGKDISPRGIGFLLPHPPASTQVYVHLPELPQVASVAGLVQIVRGQPCGDGWYEVGAFFAADEPGRK